MSDEAVTVYRRRNARCESSDPQRIIGGIGRRRNSSNNAIQSRIQQFAKSDDDNNNSTPSPPSETTDDNDDVSTTTLAKVTTNKNKTALITLATREVVTTTPTNQVKTTSNTTSARESGKLGDRDTRAKKSALQNEGLIKPTRIAETKEAPPPLKMNTKTAKSVLAKTAPAISQATSPSPRRRSKVNSSLSDTNAASEPKTPTSLRRNLQNNNGTNSNNSSIEDNKLSGNVKKEEDSASSSRSRRVSIATTTGKEHSQNFLHAEKDETPKTLRQGSLLRSKNMTWDNIASGGNVDNEKPVKKSSVITLKKTSLTPPVNRKILPGSQHTKEIDENRLLKSTREGPPTMEKPPKKVSKPNAYNGGSILNKISSIESNNDKNTEKQIKTGKEHAHDSVCNETLKQTQAVIDKRQPNNHRETPTENLLEKEPQKEKKKSEINREYDEKKKSESTTTSKKVPPPVLPKKIPTRKTSSSIAAIQNQLETNLEKPKTTREAEKKAAATRQQLSAITTITPASSMESITNQVKLRKNKLHDINNNTNEDSDVTTTSTEVREKHSTDSISSEASSNTKNLKTTEDHQKTTTTTRNTSTENIKQNVTRSKSPIKIPTKGDEEVPASSKIVEKDTTRKKSNGKWGRNEAETKEVETRQNEQFRGSDKIENEITPTGKSQNRTIRKRTDGDENNNSFETKLTAQSSKLNISSKKEVDGSIKNSERETPGSKAETEIPTNSGFYMPNCSGNAGKKYGSNNGKNSNEENVADKKILTSPDKLDHNSTEKKFQRASTNNKSDHDNFNYTGVQSIANSFHAENFTDQKESLTQQKDRSGDIFSASAYERVDSNNCSFVKETVDRYKKTTELSVTKTRKNNAEIKQTFESDTYTSGTKFCDRLVPTSTRDSSNTWTTSDSEEKFSSEDILANSASSYSSDDLKAGGREGVGRIRRRKLTKKRSKRSKTKPALVKLRHERASRQSFDTSDADILESNYTSDDKSRISSGVETLCDSDITYDKLNVELQNKVSYSNTVNKNTENILSSQSTSQKNNKNHITDKGLKSISESIQGSATEISEKNNEHGGNLKSSSMTTISSTRIPGALTSFSSTDMGGLRSDDESKLLGYKKGGKDDPAIGSVTSISKVSTKVIQSFNSKPVFSPLSKTRAQSAESSYSTASYTDISHSQVNNNINSIKTNPFSLSSNGQQDRFSDGEHEITSRLEKLNNFNCGRYSLPTSDKNYKRKPISLTELGKSLNDGESAEELLNNLPSSPFSLLVRFTRDTQIMQSRSTGSLGKRTESKGVNRDINEIEKVNNDTSIDATDHVNYHNGDDTALKEKHDNISSKVKTRPILKLSENVTEEIADFNSTLEDVPNPLRRSSYVQAHGSDEMEDSMIKLEVLKNYHSSRVEDGQSNIDQAMKRPGKRTRPRLPPAMLRSDSNEGKDDEREDVTSPTSLSQPDRNDTDSDEDLPSDFKNKVESTENKPPRTRPPLSQRTSLSGIPEEKHGNNKVNEKKKRPNRPIFAEETITEEMEPDTINTKVEETEVDYNSQGSDFLSTPKDLSIDEESEIENVNKEDEDEEEVIVTKAKTPDDQRYRNKSWSDGDRSKTPMLQVTEKRGSDSQMKIPTISTTPSSPVMPGSMAPVPKKKHPKPEMRSHVLQNLLDTEKSYVQNLGAMLTMFLNPLKRPENGHIIEPSLVDEIFYQIPEIHDSHQFFLEQLTQRVDTWSDQQIIADIFISSFTKCLLMDAYSSFITNFVQAKAAIRQASARPQFKRYVEQATKEHKEKLTLSDLLIMPVQRIPRYVLILKDMLKYTPTEHPDYGNLELALDEIKTLADRMNKGEVEADQAERDIERLRDIEQTIEGITDLVTSTRKLIRQDLVAEYIHKSSITKKDRCLFLFSDLLVCTTVRRKNANFRRGSLGLFTGQSAAELNRYKFSWKYPLEDVDVLKANSTQQNLDNEDIERLDEDVRILTNMLTDTDGLSIPHQSLDAYIREIISDVRSQIQERQSQSPPTTISTMLTKMELVAQSNGATIPHTFIFLSAECKSSWEAFLEEAKQKLAYSRDTFPPEFQYPTPITKTRSGMQFTCASPSYINGFGDPTSRTLTSGFVWVCNSDGYVGQVCLLSMIPEAQSRASLSVCQSRIACISVVPGARIVQGKSNPNSMNHPEKIKSLKQSPSFGLKHKKSLPSDMSDDDDDDFGTGAENIIAFDSSGDDDCDIPSPFMGGATTTFGGRMSPDGSSLGAGESVEGERDSTYDDYSSDDDDQVDSTRGLSSMGNTGYMLRGGGTGMDNYMNTADLDVQTTMWLGSEDGHIHVYNTQDVHNHRKSIAKQQLDAPVTSILYFENKVFIALGSGELCIYKRDVVSGAWQLSTPEVIHISITGSPIACMTAVAGRIWCGSQNTIILVNATSLKLETTITVSADHNRAVHKIVSFGLGVWVSVQSSSSVRLYHATTYENLLDVDVAPAVHKMLAGADAIIRQHKAACLRVTSLLICKDLLWIGTSAGVILTNPLPSITTSTSVLRHSIGPTGSPHGHTGHVRFLTSVEVPQSTFKTAADFDMKDSARISPSSNSNRIKRKDVNEKQKHDLCNDNGATVTLVVSGGDGYEDFRHNQQSEAVGRDDSTNHLLIWRV